MDINGIVGILSGIVALLLTVMGYNYNKNRNERKDMEDKIKSTKVEAQEYGVLVQKIETLNANVANLNNSVSARFTVIETRAEDRQTSCMAHGEKLIIVQQSVISAHKRLDEHRDYFAEINKKLDELIKNQK